MMNAFNSNGNNGYGLHIHCPQYLFSKKAYSYDNVSEEFNVLIKWKDVLEGRTNGQQVWTNMSE